MPASDKLEVLDLVELIEPQDGIPAAATGGLLELMDENTAMVEITSIPELDIERIIFPPLAKLRRIGHVKTSPNLWELTEPCGGIPAGATGKILEYRADAKFEVTSIPELDPADRTLFIPFSKLRRIGDVSAKAHDIAA
jgi:hypothetical protein